MSNDVLLKDVCGYLPCSILKFSLDLPTDLCAVAMLKTSQKVCNTNAQASCHLEAATNAMECLTIKISYKSVKNTRDPNGRWGNGFYTLLVDI